MATFERTFIHQDFDALVDRVERIIAEGSISATLEDRADYTLGSARCAVRVFERYSYTGGNRVSMNVTLFQSGNIIELCAITSGGSQALMFKLNTIGETLFLDTLREGLNG